MLFVLAFPLLFAWARWGPMDPLFDPPASTVLLDRNGALLGATVAADGQWRMASSRQVPDRFKQCLLQFEDRHFMEHHGVHFPSLVRAWKQNREAGRTISGGSTITMQLARMSGDGGSRNHVRKAIEALNAFRIELRFSKEEILQLYAANAPFGANVVGLEAAAWRWFGRDPASLSWAESAMLAVLPNSPAKLHPGKDREGLKAKRDRLLARLHAIGAIDEMDYALALEEPIPDAPVHLPQKAPHLLSTLITQGSSGNTIRSTIDAHLQDRITAMADRYANLLRANEVHNCAALVMDVRSGEVLAYIGNLPSAARDHSPAVDIIQARRSTGSLLKPFLYGAMLQQGELMPDQLVADLPTHYAGFSPRNFDERFDGAVPASQALARSLNVPAVRALHRHGIDRTMRVLRGMGLHHIDRSADNYGLSLMVGGAESTLWELTGAYASLARTVIEHSSDPIVSIHRPIVIQGEDEDRKKNAIDAAAAYHTLIALQQLNRPETEFGWKHFGGEAIAWKTGTSFGHRDAWAIGVTDRFAVGVWTGNASGEGRPGLTGTLAAAPLMFEIFGILPNGRGFDPPYDLMKRIAVCRQSGHRASFDCEPIDTTWTISQAIRTDPCPYHKKILVDRQMKFRVAPSAEARSVSWFVLPPAMEHYYAQMYPGHRSLPPWRNGENEDEEQPMQMIYPEHRSNIQVPIRLDGTHGRVVLQAAHRDRTAQIHWDLDGHHHGSTTGDHQLPLDLSEGAHRLTLTDRNGQSLSISFHVDRAKIHPN